MDIVTSYVDHCLTLMQKEMLEEKVEKLKHQLEIQRTEYKLVDKTRIKTLQVSEILTLILNTVVIPGFLKWNVDCDHTQNHTKKV